MKNFTAYILIAEAFNSGAVNSDLSKDGEQYARDKFRKLGIDYEQMIKLNERGNTARKLAKTQRQNHSLHQEKSTQKG